MTALWYVWAHDIVEILPKCHPLMLTKHQFLLIFVDFLMSNKHWGKKWLDNAFQPFSPKFPVLKGLMLKKVYKFGYILMFRQHWRLMLN